MLEQLLIGAGAMKAGTTWLYKQLDTHPHIYFTPEKEIHYFSYKNGLGKRLEHTERQRKYNRAISHHAKPKVVDWYKYYAQPEQINDAWYCSLFAAAPEQAYCADFSNQYALLPEQSLEQIPQVAKHVKVIYTLRDPLERLWSHIKFQYKFIGNEDGVDNLTVNEFNRLINNALFWKNAQYLSNYQKLVNVFGKQNVQLFYLENFIAFPQGSLWGVEKFLDIPHIEFKAEEANKKVNKTKEMPMPEQWRNIASKKLQPIYDELYAHGLTHPSWRY